MNPDWISAKACVLLPRLQDSWRLARARLSVWSLQPRLKRPAIGLMWRSVINDRGNGMRLDRHLVLNQCDALLKGRWRTAIAESWLKIKLWVKDEADTFFALCVECKEYFLVQYLFKNTLFSIKKSRNLSHLEIRRQNCQGHQVDGGAPVHWQIFPFYFVQ